MKLDVCRSWSIHAIGEERGTVTMENPHLTRTNATMVTSVIRVDDGEMYHLGREPALRRPGQSRGYVGRDRDCEVVH
jgi:hypothetical protein